MKQYDQPAYHGSPHRFDKFTLDHIGTGEGAQAYGWGLYFAGNKEVAKYYKEATVGLATNGIQPEPGSVADKASKLMLPLKYLTGVMSHITLLLGRRSG